MGSSVQRRRFALSVSNGGRFLTNRPNGMVFAERRPGANFGRGVISLSQTTATIVAVIISSGVSLIISILTIIGQSRKQTADMNTQIAVIETKMDSMKEDIATHNQYAKMFSENIPALKQHMSDVDRRLESLAGTISA